MRKGWEYKKLGEIAKCAIGLTYKPENVTEELSGTIVLRSSNIQNSILDFNDIVRVNVLVKEDKIVKDGDILMCSRNGSISLVGKVALIKNLKERMSYGAFMTIIRSQYNPYLFEYFKTPAFRQYLIAGKTTTVNQITVKMLNNLTIPLPPLSTQLAIVSELDKINELIHLKKEQLKDFDNLAQSLFYEMFGDPVENEKGWEVKKLVDNVKEMFLGPFGSALKVDSYVPKEDSYCMVYEQKHAIKKTINLENHYINKEKFDGLQRFSVMPGDFIMSCRGTIGKLYQIPKGAPLGIIHPSLMKIRLKENGYDSTYFQFMLTKIIANESTNGNCVQMAITAKALGKKELPLPPLSLQRLFAQRIEQIEREKSEVQKSIQDLETLLASRMQYWFE